MSTGRIDNLRARLSVLAPAYLDIEDQSAAHRGHAGAQSGGGHFEIMIVSAAFTGKGLLERHRIVYQAVGDMMPHQIHALSIKAYTPEEL